MKCILFLVVISLIHSCNDDTNPVLSKEEEKYRIVFTTDRDSDGQIHIELGTKCEIYSMNIDGTDQKRLTINDTYDFSPKYSNDGEKIVYSAATDWLMSEIYIMNSDGTNSINLGSGDFPKFSHDNSKVLFRHSGLIGIVNTDGTNKLILTEWADSIYSTAGQDYPVQFSSDDEKILFISRQNGNSDIFTMSNIGSQVIRLTSDPKYDGSCSFSPDDSKILFCSYRTGKGQIFIMDSDGGNQKQLTTTAEYNIRPSFSPDGKSIAFISQRDGHQEIYLMKSDGTNQTRVTNNDFLKGDPIFSPDGIYMLYSEIQEDRSDIYLYNLENEEITKLNNPDGNIYSIAFNPDIYK